VCLASLPRPREPASELEVSCFDEVPMFFRDLSIGASRYAAMPKGHTARDFNFSAHAVQEIFLTFMPRKYLLDGMAKTNLTLGPRNGDKQYAQLIDVNIYYVEDFDFRAYFAASTRERDEMLLAALEKGLLDIAGRSGADPEPIRKAIADTRACGCERRYVIKRLSRMTKSRGLKLNVFRHVFHGGESWGIDIANRKGQVLETRWIAEKTDWFRAGNNYRRSMLKGDNFVLLDFIARQSYKLNVAKIEGKLLAERRRS
jgi:hypothetical protein